MATPADLLNSVRRLEIKTSRMVNDMMVGAYHSQFKGRGMDFEELREYIPGDDVRSIDWNVTARMRRPFVKNYREERELTTVIVFDVSASNEFGTQARTKREYAAEIGGTLAFSALRNGDKVGLLLFTDEVELFVPPKKGRRHLLRILREMLAFEPKRRGTSVQRALAFLNHVLHRQSIVFLITDFLQRADQGAAERDMFREIGETNVRHDLVCIHLFDPRESVLPAAGLLTVEDAETGELIEVDTSRESVRQAFTREAERRADQLDAALMHSGVDLVRLHTGQDHAPVLQRFFETRRKR